MMAKKKEDRYKNVEELLLDLNALKNGQPPLRARKRFDVSMLEQLQAGEDVEDEEEEYEEDDAIANYRVAVLILSTVAAVFFLIISS